MRVLYLVRAASQAVKEWTSNLSLGLPRYGIQIEIVDAEDWMPPETGAGVDLGVSSKLRSRASDFDIVHAFGYGPAWACAEAFGIGEAWLYTATDPPKTRHPELIKRLNKAQAGLCGGQAIHTMLSDAGCIGLETTYPPVVVPAYVPDKDSARNDLGLGPDDRAIVLPPDFGESPRFGGMRFLTEGDRWRNMAAADLYLPGTSSSLIYMAEAMVIGCPPLLPQQLAYEFIEPFVNGFTTPSHDALESTLIELLAMGLTLESVSYAVKLRGKELFDFDPICDRHSAIYYEIGSRGA